MAGFLPQVDKLQALLKNEMTFKEKLDMAKMGKSRQLAEQYFPALQQAKSIEKAGNIQQQLITEAAKYGIDDIVPKVNEMFSSKKTQLDKRDKIRQGTLSFQAVVDQYGDNVMYNPFKNSWTSVKEFADEWIGSRGGIQNVYDLSKEFADVVTTNLMEEEYEAGTAGGPQSPTIVLKTKRKTAKGNIQDEATQTFYYDMQKGLLKYDQNKDGKIEETENADANVYAIEEVEKAMGSLRGEKEKAFDNSIQQQQVSIGMGNLYFRGQENKRSQERHDIYMENAKNAYVPKIGDVNEAYTKAFSQVQATKTGKVNFSFAEGVWGKLRDYYEKSPQAIALLENMYNFGSMSSGNIGSEQLKSLSANFKFLLDSAIKDSNLFYRDMNASERSILKEMYGAYSVADNIQQRYRLKQPIQQSDFHFKINSEKTYDSPKVFQGFKESFYEKKDQELLQQQNQLESITVDDATASDYEG